MSAPPLETSRAIREEIVKPVPELIERQCSVDGWQPRTRMTETDRLRRFTDEPGSEIVQWRAKSLKIKNI
jgi:hypothetical protein